MTDHRMTTWRVTYGYPFPAHRDFWARQPADHYADIQRQLGARDVGVTELPRTGAAGTGTRDATGGAEGLSGAGVARGAIDNKRGAEKGAQRSGRNA